MRKLNITLILVIMLGGMTLSAMAPVAKAQTVTPDYYLGKLIAINHTYTWNDDRPWVDVTLPDVPCPGDGNVVAAVNWVESSEGGNIYLYLNGNAEGLYGPHHLQEFTNIPQTWKDYFGTTNDYGLTPFTGSFTYMINFWDPNPEPQYGGPYVTITSVQALCYGVEPPDPNKPHTNVLGDGDFEQYFQSSSWVQSLYDTFIFPEGSNVEKVYGWDRYNTAKAPWPFSWVPSAMCGTGYQPIRTSIKQPGFLGIPAPTNGVASPVQQQFTWLGGTLYWRIGVRTDNVGVPFGPQVMQGKATAYVVNADGTKYELLSNQTLTTNWQTFGSTTSLPAGDYTLFLDTNNPNDNWNEIRFMPVVYYDDVMFSYYPTGAACSDPNLNEPTPTPTMQITGTASATIDPTQAPGIQTPTPNLTPLPTDVPEMLNIWNCGFEAGSNIWIFGPGSSVGLAGGPVGAQYGKAMGSLPAIYQVVSIGTNDTVYMTAWVRKGTIIQLVNVNTLAVIPLYSGTNTEWTKVFSTAYVTAGTYRLELNQIGAPYGDGNFDGITMSHGSYATADQSYCAVDPTPGPTPYLTPTRTASPTIGASRTPLPSATPWPTITAWYTWTPYALTQTLQAQQTSTAQGTPPPTMTLTAQAGQTQTAQAATATKEAQLTATAHGTPGPGGSTETPGPGGTLTPGGTPGPGQTPGPPGQPPGGDGAPCIRPDNIDPAYWLDYEVCQGKAFISWGDHNTQQVKDIMSGFNKYEPFGTIQEVKDSIVAFDGILQYYNWSNTGIPGTGPNSSPSSTMFTNQSSSIWTGGRFSLQGSGPNYSVYCAITAPAGQPAELGNIVGPRLSQSLCFVFDILYQNNLTPWLQAFINLAALWGLVVYVKKNYIDKAS